MNLAAVVFATAERSRLSTVIGMYSVSLECDRVSFTFCLRCTAKDHTVEVVYFSIRLSYCAALETAVSPKREGGKVAVKCVSSRWIRNSWVVGDGDDDDDDVCEPEIDRQRKYNSEINISV